MCRALQAGLEEESLFPSEGGCESCLCQEGTLWMLGSAIGLEFGIGVSPGCSYSRSSDHSKLGWGCGCVGVGCGEGRKGETVVGREPIL